MALEAAENSSSWGNAKVVLMGYATIIGIGGLLGNGLVIFLFIHFKSLRTVTNNFIINLAVCDIAIAILDLGFSIPTLFFSEWIFGQTLGVIYAFGHFLLVSSSMVMLAIIAVDRYHVIARQKLGARITSSKSLVVIAIVYVYTLAISSPILYAPAGVDIRAYASGCYINFTPTSNFGSGSYAIVIAASLFLAPLATMVYYYRKIYTVLRKRQNRAQSEKAVQNRRRYESRRGSTYATRCPPVKTLRLMTALIGFFVVTWTPFMVVTLARACDQSEYFNDFVKEVTILLTKSVVIINPVAYALVNHRFQKCVAKLFCCAQVVIGGGTTTDNSLDFGGPAARSSRTSAEILRRSRLSRQDNPRESTNNDVMLTPKTHVTVQFAYNDYHLVPPHDCGKLGTKSEQCNETPRERNESKDSEKSGFLKLGVDGSKRLKTDWETSVTTF